MSFSLVVLSKYTSDECNPRVANHVVNWMSLSRGGKVDKVKSHFSTPSTDATLF